MMDIPFAFLINGKQLNPHNPESPEQATKMQQIVASISDRVDGLVCEEHKEPPRFLCTGENIDDLSLQVHGCCEKLVKMAENCLTLELE